jgi:long-chain fatty acid transport protein
VRGGRQKTRSWAGVAGAALACASAATSAIANNGLNMLGFGTESVGMGGADVAVARDTGALNSNPAGITQLKSQAFDGYFAVAYGLNVAHADTLGNDQRVDNHFIPAGGFGYTAPIGDRLTAGVGLFAQGGAGNTYKTLVTPYGTVDQLSGLIGFVKLSPAIAWQATDTLSIAFSLPVAAINTQQRVFPNTSSFNAANPAQSFFGLNLKNAWGAGVGAKVGALWRASRELSIGATAATKISLPARNGYANVNMIAAGLGIVRYNDAQLNGFALPPEVALGAAWQATARLLFSAEVTWLGWSHALRSTTLMLSQPENPAAPQALSQTAAVDAHDQWVFALGAAYASSPTLTFYGGINYGRAPVPPQNLTPLLAPIGELHFTTGFKHALSPDWSISGALEYLAPNSVSYNNPASPLGPSTERLSYVALYVMVSRRW